MKKPEVLVTPIDLESIEQLAIIGADSFLIGEEKFGLRLAGEFLPSQVAEALKITQSYNKKLYIAVNILIHEEHLNDVTEYLKFLAKLGVDGVLFSDPSVLMIVRENNLDLALHFGADTTVTNYETCNFWARKGIDRVIPARELDWASLKEIREKSQVEIEVQVYGAISMFQSKRYLVDNFINYNEGDIPSKYPDDMVLYDGERKLNYPVFQDKNGTHIMGSCDICMIDELDLFLDNGFDVLRIEGVLNSKGHIIEVVKLYISALNLAVFDRASYKEKSRSFLKSINELPSRVRTVDRGFYYKKTVY